MKKLKVSQIVVVEGKYDAIKLDSIIDGLIIPVNGFSVFSDDEKKALIKELGKKNGIILVTDSDTAGFKIRNYIKNICRDSKITHVYIPPVVGKESRKQTPSKEGLLGVEGIDKDTLIKCFKDAGITDDEKHNKTSNMTYTDLFELGLSGTQNSSKNREKLAFYLKIPTKLSKKSLLEVLNRMCTKEQIEDILDQKPVLFWDFHGTLTKPDNQWIDAVIGLCDEYFPEKNIPKEILVKNFRGQCLPWWTYPDRDTRHLVENDGWWKSCEKEFVEKYMNCGLTEEEAKKLAPLIRPYVVDSKNHRLHDDSISTLKELKKRGYKSYILSNNFPELPTLAREMGLMEYFEGCIVSARVGYAKPRKELFKYAQKEAGNPYECVMIGDNPEDDMKGAKNVGFTTVLVNDRHPEYNGDYCDYICKTLTDLLTVFY